MICYNVLDHVRDPERALKEMRRILRVGGTLYLNCRVISRLLVPLRGVLRPMDAAGVVMCGRSLHVRNGEHVK